MPKTIIFNANNGLTGTEPWITDGTEAGTLLLSDIFAGTSTSGATGFFDLGNGLMLFSANNNIAGTELWVTDGTAAGTSLLRDIRTLPPSLGSLVPGSSVPGSFFSIAPGRALFRANDGTNGSELWITDGTAAGTSMLADINPGTVVSGGLTVGNGGAPSNFAAAPNGRTVFSATQGTTGTELWVTDGTGAGTSLLADIAAGTASSSPQGFFRLPGGSLLFSATTAATGRELWITDGTSAGTGLVKDLFPGTSGGANFNGVSGGAALGNGKVVFSTYSYGNAEPWVTDGTAAGTYQLAEIRAGAAGSSPSGFTAIGGGKAVFAANDGTSGVELWIADGTSGGTSRVLDINPGAAGSGPQTFIPLPGGKFVFSALGSAATGRELWVSDGTAAGTSLVKDIVPGASSSTPTLIGAVTDGRVLFAATDATVGRELWITDGTAAGTSVLKDINPLTTLNTSGPSLPASGNPASFLALGGGQFAFAANDGFTGTEVWVTDGTSAGTHRAGDVNLFNAGSNTLAPTQNRVFADIGGGKFTFVANDGVNGNELWVTDTTTGGTSLLRDINPGLNGSGPSNAVPIGGGRAMFNALGPAGRVLWVTDGTAAGTSLAPTVGATGIGAVLPSGQLLLTGFDAAHGTELWTSDGTAAGTSLLKDIEPGAISSYPTFFRPLGTGAVFTARTSAEGSELWVTDGSATGTSLLKDIKPGAAGNSYITAITAFGGRLLFSADNGTQGSELWVTDGTSAGTSLLTDIRPGAGASNPYLITDLGNGTAIFRADDGTHGNELWVTDGTGAGTSLVRDIVPGVYGSFFGNPATIGGGKAVLSVYAPGTGTELWVTDGTTGGTSLLADIVPGSGGSYVSYTTSMGNGRAVFAATTAAAGAELWITDGTAAGTSLVRDIVPGATGSSPKAFKATGDGRVLFEAFTPTTGIEVWITDGTAAGTTMVKDVNPLTAASNPAALTVFQSNDAPVLAAPIPDVSTFEDSAFVFAVLAESFADPNPWDTHLVYTASLANGGALPGWLSFDAGTQTFSGTPANGDVGTVSLRVTATDKFGKSASDVFDATVVNTNDAPVAGGTLAGQAISDKDTIAPFAAVTIEDVDAGDIDTATVTLSAAGNGVLSNLGGGIYDSGTGIYTVSGTPGQVQAALRGLIFHPTENQTTPGQIVTTGFALTVADAFVSVADTATSVVALSVEDAATIAGTVAGQAVADNATLHPLAAVAIADPDFGATEAVTLTLTASGGGATDANGLLSGAGLIKTGVGTYTLAAGSPASVSAALASLTFTPTANQVLPGQTVTTGLSIAVDDGFLVSTDAATSIVATSVNDGPVITVVGPAQTPGNAGPLRIFAGVVVTDADFGAQDGAAIVTRNAGGGGNGCEWPSVGRGPDQDRCWNLHAGGGDTRGADSGFGGSGVRAGRGRRQPARHQLCPDGLRRNGVHGLRRHQHDRERQWQRHDLWRARRLQRGHSGQWERDGHAVRRIQHGGGGERERDRNWRAGRVQPGEAGERQRHGDAGGRVEHDCRGQRQRDDHGLAGRAYLGHAGERQRHGDAGGRVEHDCRGQRQRDDHGLAGRAYLGHAGERQRHREHWRDRGHYSSGQWRQSGLRHPGDGVHRLGVWQRHDFRGWGRQYD